MGTRSSRRIHRWAWEEEGVTGEELVGEGLPGEEGGQARA
jgi:hypothetical protein